MEGFPKRQRSRSGVVYPVAKTRTQTMMQAITQQTQMRTSQHSIRLEVLLAANGQYTFQINETQSPGKNATEVRVRQADVFIPLSMGLFIKRATVAAAPITDAEHAYSTLHTFPDSYVFTAANEARNLEAIYNSTLQFNLGNQTLIQSLDVLQFRRVGMAQQAMQASQQAAAVGTNGSYSRSQWDGADYGMAPVLQHMAFNGNANQNIVLQLPAAVDCAAAAGSANYATIQMRGIVIFNASEKIKDSSMLSFLSH
jgi:hypothetical protein